MTAQNSDQISPMELPSPQVDTQPPTVEQVQNMPTTETGASQAIEQAISVPSSTPTQIDNSTAASPQQTMPMLDPQSIAQPTPTIGMPQIADDSDLIEKEWVVKAKEIVEKTRNDPHLQNQEISKVKADYLKKRYNKEIKVNEG